MKKIITIAIVMLVVLTFSVPVFALTINPTVKVDGQTVAFPDELPYIDSNDRTMIPIRFVSNALGAEVSWEETRQLVTMIKDTTRIALIIGEDSAIVNTPTSDSKKTFDTVSILKDDRTFVPLRFVSETFGAGVAWDGVNNTVLIRSDGTVEQVAMAPVEKMYVKDPKHTLIGLTEEKINSNPILKQLALLDGFVSASNDGNGGYDFSYKENYTMEDGLVRSLAANNVSYFVQAESKYKLYGFIDTTIFKYSASCMARFKNIMDITNVPNKDEIYQIADSHMGSKDTSTYSNFSFYGNHLFMQYNKTTQYKTEEQGVFISLERN